MKAAGWLEQVIIYIYRCCERCDCPPSFDEARMDHSLEIFRGLGAKDHHLLQEGGQASIHMITMKASDLQNILKQKGAKWVKLGNEFVILPPKNPSADWGQFQKEYLLNKTGWFLADRNGRKVIVTCENADLVNAGQKNCFLHIHYPFIRQRNRAGFYLGMMKDCAFYDVPGVRNSKGTPSEKGFYLSSEAALAKLLSLGFSPSDIWVSGSCKTASVAAYLKKKYHAQGINFVSEQGYIDLEKEMIDSQSWIPRLFAKWNLDALKSRDIPSDVAPHVEEDHFNTEKKWKNLPLMRRGKVVIINAKNDRTIPPGAETRYFELAKKVNEQVFLRYFDSPPGMNGHNGSCYDDPNMKREFIKIVFDRVKPDEFPKSNR